MPKLAINQPGDKYEQEADRVADQVMRMADAEVLQRKCAKCEEEEVGKKLQRKEASAAATPAAAPPIVHDVINSPGQPLDAATRAFFEPRFGRDLSDVRIHQDSKAAASANRVDALAYTVGNHIVFRGDVDPHSNRQVLAHELVHVQQQGVRQEPTLQRLPGSPAGGCGLCYGSPRAVGIEAHALIEAEMKRMYPWLETEYPFSVLPAPSTGLIPSPTDENARLDMLDPSLGQIAIGEIKPANIAGFLQGDLDLMWYEDQIKRFGMSATRMILPPPFGPIKFPTLAPNGCTQFQDLYVNPPVHGIYTYWCMPDYSQLIQDCDCLKGKRRKVNEACKKDGCDAYAYCGGERMVLENCGSGTCPTCPAGGNMAVKGWCTYASETSEQRAIVLRMRFLGDRIMCGIY